MKTPSPSRQYLPRIAAGVAVILFSTAGIAAMMGWRSALIDGAGNAAAVAHEDSTNAPAKVDAPTARASQKWSKARANGRCAECGLIVSMHEITGRDDEFGMASGVTDGDEDAKPLTMATQYEIIVRMADGSSRVINTATPASWRLGGRVIVIAGTVQSHK